MADLDYGYGTYSGIHVPHEIVQKLEDSVRNLKYFDFAECSDEVRNVWNEFIDRSMNLNTILSYWFKGTSNLQRQGPIIVSEIVSPLETPRLRRSHPCGDGISIWRPIRNGVGPEHGLFRVYPGSHKFPSEQELHNSGIHALDIRIRADQVLITRGGLWIEERSGTGLLMWMGYSEDIIGLHIDKYSLLFIAQAYGASHFLSRHRALGKIEWETTEFAQGDFSFPPQERNAGSGNSNSRIETAEGVLNRAQEGLKEVQGFIIQLGDPTGLILSADYGCVKDPRTALLFLNMRQDLDLRKWFLRAVAIRYLVKRYWATQKSIEDFVKEEQLPGTTKAIIQYGHKVYLGELALKQPGIWLTLMGVLSKFSKMSFSHVYRIPSLLHERYPEIIEAAKGWSRLMANSSQLYIDQLSSMVEGSSP